MQNSRISTTTPSACIFADEVNSIGKAKRESSSNRFEDVRIYGLNIGVFKHGAAMTIPGIGIFIGTKDKNNINLLRHEFGHILQYRRWGAIVFWFKIAPTSLKSAYKATKSISYKHMDTWCEWSANELSYQYFNRPTDWEHDFYPILPSKKIT